LTFLLPLDKPVVTALNGTTSGGALAFTLFADIIVAERHVELSDPHVPAGVAAGDGGVLVWPLALGLLRAKRHLYTGDPISADEALALGLVTEVVERGESPWRGRCTGRSVSPRRRARRFGIPSARSINGSGSECRRSTPPGPARP